MKCGSENITRNNDKTQGVKMHSRSGNIGTPAFFNPAGSCRFFHSRICNRPRDRKGDKKVNTFQNKHCFLLSFSYFMPICYNTGQYINPLHKVVNFNLVGFQLFPDLFCCSFSLRVLTLYAFYRAMHFSANVRSWDRMSSVRPLSVRL